MNAEDAKVLAQALIDQGPCQCEYIFLQQNKIGDEGMEAIAKAMAAGALPKLLTVDFVQSQRTETWEVQLAAFQVGSREHRDSCPSRRQRARGDVGAPLVGSRLG